MAKTATSKQITQLTSEVKSTPTDLSELSLSTFKLPSQTRDLINGFIAFVKSNGLTQSNSKDSIKSWTRERLSLRNEAKESASAEHKEYGVYWAPPTYPVDPWDTPGDAPATKPSKEFAELLKKAFLEIKPR